MNRMKNKVVIVTGGAQGIGATYARALAAEGADVAIADVLDGSAVATEIEAGGQRALYIKTDVTDQDQARAMAETVQERFGRIDVLVNNAAIYASCKCVRSTRSIWTSGTR